MKGVELAERSTWQEGVVQNELSRFHGLSNCLYHQLHSLIFLNDMIRSRGHASKLYDHFNHYLYMETCLDYTRSNSFHSSHMAAD